MNTTALKYLQENQHSIFAIAYAAVSEGSPLLPNLNKIGYDENKLEELSGFLGQVLGDSAEEEA